MPENQEQRFFANFFLKKVITNVARFVELGSMKVAIVC